jgi:hypothetical protein
MGVEGRWGYGRKWHRIFIDTRESPLYSCRLIYGQLKIKPHSMQQFPGKGKGRATFNASP